jgi:hypothetical protein
LSVILHLIKTLDDEEDGVIFNVNPETSAIFLLFLRLILITHQCPAGVVAKASCPDITVLSIESALTVPAPALIVPTAFA